MKKQSSFLSCPSVIPSFSGMRNSEEQKQCQVDTEKDTTASSSRAFGESRGRADILQHDGLPQIWGSMNHDGKTTDPSSLCCYEKNVRGKNVQCRRCKEVGHVSQFCRGSSTLKASAERSFRVVTNKRNKWESMEAAAMSSGTIPINNRLPDKFNGLSKASFDLSYGVASKDQLPSTSNCSRHLTLPDGRSKLEWQQTHANLVVPFVSDETKLKPHLMSMPINASIPGNPSRISAIPEHDYIWQYAFFSFFDFFLIFGALIEEVHCTVKTILPSSVSLSV